MHGIATVWFLLRKPSSTPKSTAVLDRVRLMGSHGCCGLRDRRVVAFDFVRQRRGGEGGDGVEPPAVCVTGGSSGVPREVGLFVHSWLRHRYNSTAIFLAFIPGKRY